MTQKQSTRSGAAGDPASAAALPASARKPYHRPAIVSCEPMEALAGFCSITQGMKSDGNDACGGTRS
jgi:hypothetical protein